MMFDILPAEFSGESSQQRTLPTADLPHHNHQGALQHTEESQQLRHHELLAE